MSQPPLDELCISAHEIGHALAFHLVGIQVHRVQFTRSLWNGVLHGATSIPAGEIPDEQLDGFAVGLLAGMEADARCRTQYGGLDLGTAREQAAWGGESDRAEFRTIRGRLGLTESQARRQAENLVARHWDRIDRIATKLARRKQLSGSAATG